MQSAHIRLNEIKKRRALFRNRTVVLLTNSGALSKCLLLIPSFFYFVNPFFVISNAGSSNKSKFRKHSQTNCNAGRALFAILRKKNRETTQLRIANRYVVSQFFLPNHTIPFPFKIM